ncbi:MAG: DEAD/DEAH box helicase family protein, partial [Eubacteriales bacterium]|nr:DEAD/DEAH box helicase family protein [Eubacteriales bacterium]
KTALFLSTRVGFDKVIFLADRRELDKNTSEKFKAYSAYEPVMVDETKSTYQLKQRLKDQARGIVVTTTFKLNSLVKECLENDDKHLKNKKLVFIIDEAHRTTMGQMMGIIQEYFKKNTLFFGFTGTPLFEENQVSGMINQKSEVINTTEKLFGPLLHEYTIDEAIRDGNVLGFHVDYINTGEFSSYEQLKAELTERELSEHPDKSVKEVQREVAGMTNADIERSAALKDILIYQDETHIPRVVSEILDNWEPQSQKRKFNGILTCAYKHRVVDYYQEFKKQLAERDQTLNVAMTFSAGNENDPERVSKDIIEMMFTDYASYTGIKFIPGDLRNGEDAYFANLISRFTNGGSKDNPKNVDLIIVAEQLLTGYDSKMLNTLYVDRPLQLQGLIQAYSRTNRVLDSSKEFGSIVNFQYPAITREAVEKALALYSSGGSSSRAIVDVYDVAVRRLKIAVTDMRKILYDPTKWAELKGHEEKQEEFNSAFKAALRQLNTVKQYYEFEWNDELFGIDEHTWHQYVGAYKNLNPRVTTEENEIKELIGQTMLIDSHPIDLPFILKLIDHEINKETDVQVVDAESQRIIYEQIAELSNMGDDRQAKLLKTFVDTYLIPGLLPSSVKFDDAFGEWKKQEQKHEISKFADDWGVDEEILSKASQQYSVNNVSYVPYSEELLDSVNPRLANFKHKSTLVHNMKLTETLPLFLEEMEEKYSV